MAARELRLRAAIAVGTVALTMLGGWATGFRRPAPVEIVRQHQLAEAGLGPEQILPGDVRVRLAIPPQDIATVAALLSAGTQTEPDMTWQTDLDGRSALPAPAGLPSREEAPRALIDFLAPLSSTDRQAAIWQFRINAALTPLARDLVRSLQEVPPHERSQVIPLLAAIMRLPPDQRATLERAGYPAMPPDADRQELYQLISRAAPEQAAFVFNLLRQPDRQSALARVDRLLQSKVNRRVLGAVADGTLIFANIPNLPFGCDIGTPFSCR